MDFKIYLNKRIFVKLKDSSCYTGEVEFIDEDSIPNDVLITITDKYGKMVTFWASEIYKLKEEGR